MSEIEIEIEQLLGQAGGQALELAGRTALAYFRQPENLAGLAGSILAPPLVFRGRVPRLLPWLLVALAGDQVFRLGYRAQRNLQVLADRVQPPELVFHHGADCPGHTTGKPGKRCLEDLADTAG